MKKVYRELTYDESSNCTLVELKCRKEKEVMSNFKRSNCTLVELKFGKATVTEVLTEF